MAKTPTASAAPLRGTAAAAALGAPMRRGPVKATDTVDGHRPMVLVVEPDPRTRSLLDIGLSERGFEVFAAASAEEAELCFRPDRMLPAMIFCEAFLTGADADGVALCSRVRSDERASDLPVVLMSRTPDALLQDLAGGAGADQLLPKPFFLNDAVAMARLMAGRSSSGGRYDTDTAELPLSQALRALLSGVRAGRIELHPGPAWITFRDGRVVDSGWHGLRGEEALSRMLLLAHGRYTVHFGPSLTRATMAFGVEELCRKTYPRLQKWEQLLNGQITLDALRVVDFAAFATVQRDLPAGVQSMARLFDGRRTVRDVVLESRLDEVSALEAVVRLQAIGVLREPSDRERLGAGTRVRALPPGRENGHADMLDAGGAAPESLYESTGTLDKDLLRQLSAFRIKQVAEMTEHVPASPELTTFVRANAERTHASVEPAPERPAVPDLARFGEPAAPPLPSTPPGAARAIAAAPALPLASWPTVAAAPVSVVQPPSSVAVQPPPPAVRTAPTASAVAPMLPVPPVATPIEQVLAAVAAAPAVQVTPAPEPVAAVPTQTARAPEPVASAREPVPSPPETVAPAIVREVTPIPLTVEVPPDDELAHADEHFFASLDALEAPERPTDRRWLVGGIVGTAALAVLAGIAVVVSTRGDDSARTAEPPTPAPLAPPALATEPPPLEQAAPPADVADPMAISAAALAADADAQAAAAEALEEVSRGVSLYESGKYRDSLEVLEQVTRDHPNLPVAWVYLGLARFDRHNSRGAEQAAMKALQLEPRNGKALLLLASIYLSAGQQEKAQVELRRYLELHPKGPWADEARQLLAGR